jgi:hypothetical protein
MSCWGFLKEDCPFQSILGNGRVPIRSIVPIVPRKRGCPICYIVLGEQLTDEQVHLLAELLYEMWQPECSSIEEAITYIRQGLPLKTSWFRSVGTDDYFYVPVGVALNIAAHHNAASLEEF